MARKIVFLLILLLSTPAVAADVAAPAIKLQQGEAAPYAGALFGEAAIAALANVLSKHNVLVDELRLQTEQIEALKAQGIEQEQAIQALEESRKQTELALAKAEWLLEHGERIQAEYQKLVSLYKEANERLAQDAKDARADARWARVLGLIPLLGGVILAFSGL